MTIQDKVQEAITGVSIDLSTQDATVLLTEWEKLVDKNVLSIEDKYSTARVKLHQLTKLDTFIRQITAHAVSMDETEKQLFAGYYQPLENDIESVNTQTME